MRFEKSLAARLVSLVLSHLRTINEVAYIRFASVYKQFRGIRDFVETLNHLKESTQTEESTPGGRVVVVPMGTAR